MNNRIIMGISVLILLINITGCSGKMELDELGIVSMTSVDKDSRTGRFKIAVQIISPQSGTGGADIEVWIASATGHTLMKASKNLRSIVSKKLVWYHSNIIIIGEELAKEGLSNFADYFARNQEFRYSNWVLISKGKAEEVIKLAPRFNSSLSQEIEGIINNKDDWGKDHAVTLKDFLVSLVSKDIDEVAGNITYYHPKIEPEGTYKQEDIVEDLRSEERRVVALSGLSVLKDGTYVGVFNRSEARGYLWITNQVKGGIVEIVDGNTIDSEKLSLEISSAESSFKPNYDNDSIEFDLKIKASFSMTEEINSLDLTLPENIIIMQKKIVKKIRKNIERALAKAQRDYKADIFGYGESIYRSNPKKWEEIKGDWNQIFSTVKTNIEVEVTIKRLGVISKPIF